MKLLCDHLVSESIPDIRYGSGVTVLSPASSAPQNTDALSKFEQR